MLTLWEPGVIEESLAIIGWPKQDYNETSENSVSFYFIFQDILVSIFIIFRVY